MRITTKGQVTIPQRFRLKFGLLPHTDVRFEETDGGVTIRPVASKRALIEERLRGVRGVARRGVRTDEIMRLTRGDDCVFLVDANVLLDVFTRAYRAYRRAGGVRSAPLPDFYIGAHAEADSLTLVTRDARRFRTYFPTVKLVFARGFVLNRERFPQAPGVVVEPGVLPAASSS